MQSLFTAPQTCPSHRVIEPVFDCLVEEKGICEVRNGAAFVILMLAWHSLWLQNGVFEQHPHLCFFLMATGLTTAGTYVHHILIQLVLVQQVIEGGRWLSWHHHTSRESCS